MSMTFDSIFNEAAITAVLVKTDIASASDFSPISWQILQRYSQATIMRGIYKKVFIPFTSLPTYLRVEIIFSKNDRAAISIEIEHTADTENVILLLDVLNSKITHIAIKAHI